jgi:cysteine-rich repeat protein
MIRSAIRDLVGSFPLFAILGSVAICAAGLVSFDSSLALVRGDRVLRRAAPTTPVVPAKRKIGGRTFTITSPTRRQMLRALSGSTAVSPSSRAPIQYERARCGDKLILLAEECDDGNAVSGDGCSSACKIESGFNCNRGQPTTCTYSCGDALIAAGKEGCDDANSADGDGCSAYCHTEPGYSCSGTPSTCELTE